MSDWEAVEGSPSPFGATWIAAERAFNFALHARDATAVTLLLYDAADLKRPARRVPLDPLTNKSGAIWHCRLGEAVIGTAVYYAYSVDGPDARGQGHRFDREKTLFDPYARALHFPPDFSREAARAPGGTAGRAPVGRLCREQPFDWTGDTRIAHTSDLVIYELHVRQFTRRANSGVRPDARGTYAGVVDKIPYLQALGVTAVELMPVFQQDPQEGSAWGYMPISFFALHEGYAAAASSDSAVEFKRMVRALHAAGIEVILDVVYNHTAEGDETGPTYSYRGIDNTSYYLLRPDREHYRNDTGTGNTLDFSNSYVRRMVVDSIRHWRRATHVDGFRFDLASIFTHKEDGSFDLDDPPAIAEISGSDDMHGIRLIAEAWDPLTYELGRRFPGHSWLQWNGRFRDDVRAFMKGDPQTVPALMARVYGSADLFPDDVMNAYHAYQSVNYVTCHDGFCLADLVAFNRKHNEANGEANRDGTDHNVSWNCGWEGYEGAPPAVMDLRKRQVKNFCALLFLSNGTPMFHAGDEFMHTQHGNNNAYKQDDDTTWLDWGLLDTNADIVRFFSRMIAFRKAHPSVSRSRFWRGDVRWYGTAGAPDLSFESHSLAWYLDGASQQDDDLYVMVNAFWEPLTFVVQEGRRGQWRLAVDTSLASPADITVPGRERHLDGMRYTAAPRSIVVLVRPQAAADPASIGAAQ